MSLKQDKDKRAKTDPGSGANRAASPSPSPPPRRKNVSSNDVGTALRSAYERTIEEEIPTERLYLRGRLT